MRPEMAALLLWLLFLLSWHGAMLWTSRAVTRETLGKRLVYFLCFAAGFVLLFIRPEWFGPRAASHPPSWLRMLWNSAGAGWLLVLVELAAFGFAWWARVHLGRLWSGMLTIREGHKVVDTGPYRLVRHPIYTGFIAAVWAFALLRANAAALAGAAILTLTMAVKAKAEELFLRRELGSDAYDDYARQTPMLVPFAPR